jgi:hypothetical protein
LAPLRAQIRLTTNVARGFDRSLTVSQEQAVLQVVQTWLAEVLVAADGGEGDGENRQRSR